MGSNLAETQRILSAANRELSAGEARLREALEYAAETEARHLREQRRDLAAAERRGRAEKAKRRRAAFRVVE